jgi:hypothetical protein
MDIRAVRGTGVHMIGIIQSCLIDTVRFDIYFDQLIESIVVDERIRHGDDRVDICLQE